MRAVGDILRDAALAAEAAPPTVIFGSNDRLSRRLVVALRQASMALTTQVDSLGWSNLQSTWLFQLQPGQHSYPLPPDYLSLIRGTSIIDNHSRQLMSGPVDPEGFAQWRAGHCLPATQYGCRVRMGRLYVEPVPTVAQVVTFDYLSRWPALQYITGWDGALWDGAPGEHARAPYVTREGYLAVTASDLGLTQDAFDAAYRLKAQPTGWDSGNDADGDGWPDAFVRKAFFTADTDFCALDGDLMLMEVTWRARRAVGLPYAEEAAQAERMREVLMAHDHGGAPDIDIDAMASRQWEPPLPSDGGKGLW